MTRTVAKTGTRTAWALSILTIIGAAPTTANGQTVIDYRTKGPAVGTTFVYKSSRGSTLTLTLESRTRFKSSTGGSVVKNRDGNTLRNSSRVFTPHSGYRPSDSGGALVVGQSWTHRFSVNGLRRIRRCKVERQGRYANASISVLGAFKVACTNRRLDRPNPMNEEIWFSPNLLTELDYRATWDSTGGFSYRLVGVR